MGPENQAEPGEKKPRQTYDWPRLELEYTSGPRGQTLRQFAEDKGINLGTLYGKAEELDWRAKKQEFHRIKNAQLRAMCINSEVLSMEDVLKGIGSVLSKMFAILDDVNPENADLMDKYVGLTERMVNTFLLLTGEPTVREAHEVSGLGDETELGKLRAIIKHESTSRLARTSDN